MIKIVVVDDHDIIREGIKRIIADSGEYTVVAEAGSGEAALAAVREHKPDILLLDLSMPEGNGLDVIERIHRVSSRTKIIVVTMHRTPVYIDRAVRSGVQGYMHKENVVADLLVALKRVMNGEVYLC
jgi:two-component system invasion response regulator UvrY